MKQFLSWTAVAVAVGFLAWACWDSISAPIVKTSWMTQECVAVEPAGSCDDLPEKYHVVWVR